MDKIMTSGKKGYGFDAYNETYCDMMAAGIVDPTKVTEALCRTPHRWLPWCSPPRPWWPTGPSRRLPWLRLPAWAICTN